MTQLSNTPMQPKSDAVERPLTLVERPLTLVEKLRNRRNEWASNPHYWMDSNLIGDVFNDAIKIVKQHSDWIPVSELPKEEKYWLVRFRKEDGFGLTMAVSKFYLEAQRFDCFHSKVTHYMELPKPPSEVQDD